MGESVDNKLLVVHGIGGAGKSQLVLNYVQEYRQDYAAIFWIEAGQRESLERDFFSIYSFLFNVQPRMGQENVRIEEVVTIVKNWFVGQKGKSLFIFDNADTIDNPEDDSYIDIELYLPTDPSVHIIVTSRCGAAREMMNLEAVEVGQMELRVAMELFVRSAKMSQYPVAVGELELIVMELGLLALAVSLAGSYVSVTPRLRSEIRL